MATEKRYRVMSHDDYELDYIADSKQGFEKVYLYDCCDLLNENEQLKIQLKIHKTDALETLNDLERAYENNKKALRNIEQLEEENKELKQELKDYHNAFDCSQCRYQNYDWFGDGEEFEVCDRGNNEAQMDNHSCKEWEEL